MFLIFYLCLFVAVVCLSVCLSVFLCMSLRAKIYASVKRYCEPITHAYLLSLLCVLLHSGEWVDQEMCPNNSEQSHTNVVLDTSEVLGAEQHQGRPHRRPDREASGARTAIVNSASVLVCNASSSVVLGDGTRPLHAVQA